MHPDRATARSSASGRRRAGWYRFAVVDDAAQLDVGFLELRMSLHDHRLPGRTSFAKQQRSFDFDTTRIEGSWLTRPRRSPQSSYQQAAKLRIWQFPLSTTGRCSDNNAASRHTRHVRKGAHYKRVHAARESRMHTNQAPATNCRWPPSRQQANADRPPGRWALVMAGAPPGRHLTVRECHDPTALRTSANPRYTISTACGVSEATRFRQQPRWR